MNFETERDQENFPPLALMIMTDRYDRPISVAIPLSDWEKLRPSLHPKSPLYHLLQKLYKETPDGAVPYVSPSIADAEEIEQTEIIYKNELCTEPALFVMETAKQKDLIKVRYTSETYGFLERL